MENHFDFNMYTEMIELLTTDADNCRKRLHQKNPQFWRRMYVRALFAAFEGICYLLKQQALYAKCLKMAEEARAGALQIPTGDLCLLPEESYFLDDKGDIKRRPATTPTLPNVLYALKSIAGASGSEHKINKDSGWSAYREAVKIRDRITHPKSRNNMMITDQDLDVVARANAWLQRESMAIIYSSKLIKELPNNRLHRVRGARSGGMNHNNHEGGHRAG